MQTKKPKLPVSVENASTQEKRPCSSVDLICLIEKNGKLQTFLEKFSKSEHAKKTTYFQHMALSGLIFSTNKIKSGPL